MHMYFVLVVIFCKFLVADCFLLDTSTPAGHVGGPVLTDKHYAALIELLLDEKQHRYQLEQRVTALEQTRGSVHQSDKISQLEQYVLKLEDRVKQLEDNVSACSTVTTETIQRTEFVNETAIITRRFDVLEKKYNDLEKKQDMNNKIVEQLKVKVLGLEQLKNINQIQTLNALEHEVQSLNTKTSMLISNGKARAEDFLAMYNRTVSFETVIYNKVHQVEKKLNETTASQFSYLSNYIQGVDNRDNISTSNLQTEVVNMKQFIKAIDKRLNTTTGASESQISRLQSQLQDMERQQNSSTQMLTKMTSDNAPVAVTACLASGGSYSNEVAIFASVKESVGMLSNNSFTNSGIFTCEHAGLYLVSVTILIGPSQDGYIYIMKNRNQPYNFADGAVNRDSHTLTAMASVLLSKNDKLSVKLNSASIYASDYSCVTIIRIS